MGSLETVGQRSIQRWAITLAALGLAAIAEGGCSGPTDSKPVAAIDIQPASVGVLVQSQTTLRAIAVDAGGKPMGVVPMHWSSADTDIATVSGSGVVTAATPGRVNIAASADGVTGIAIVTVSPVTVARVVVVPETLTVMPKASGQLEAAAFGPSGDQVAGLSIVWGSSHQSVATVDASGRVTGVSPGTSTVTAAMGGHIASATVVVEKPPQQPPPTPHRPHHHRPHHHRPHHHRPHHHRPHHHRPHHHRPHHHRQNRPSRRRHQNRRSRQNRRSHQNRRRTNRRHKILGKGRQDPGRGEASVHRRSG